jgi:hypothetical protein
MRIGHLLRTQAFRIVLVYVLLFALSVTTLMAFTYWNTVRTLDGQTDQIVAAEITGLAEQYHHLGLRGWPKACMRVQPAPVSRCIFSPTINAAASPAIWIPGRKRW